MKKFFSVILVLALTVTAVPLFTLPTAFAADWADVLDYETNDDGTGIIITGCDEDAGGDLVIPDEIDGLPVTEIGDWAFCGCTNLASVTIPDSVTSIGDGAFVGCFSLTAINVNTDNASYSDIDGVLFSKDATILVCYPGGKSGSYTIPDSVTSIGDEAFNDCFKLTSVTIGNSVTSIGNSAFYGCTLESVIIPENVISIGYGAFTCFSITEITVPSDTSRLGDDVFTAFYGSSGVTTIKIGNFAWNDEGELEENAESYSASDEVDLNKLPTEKAEDVYFYNPSAQIIGNIANTAARVHGYKDSTAEIFANENSYVFIDIEGASNIDKLALNPDSELQINDSLKALTGIAAGATVEDILAQFTDGDIGIYKDGVKLENDDLVGTGCEIRLINGDDEILDSLTVVVKGDLDGDGKVNVPDARKALRAAVKLDTISDFQSLAADVDGSGKVEVPDARLILRVAVGLQGFPNIVSDIPSTKAQVFEFYKTAIDKIKTQGAAGHTKKEWQTIDFLDMNHSSIIKPLIETYINSEEEADESVSAKGSEEAKNRMAPCGASIDKVKSATCVASGDNYIITIVMNEEVNPEKGSDGVASMATGILYMEDVKDTIANDSTVSALVKSLDEDSKITYKAYTVTAIITKDGKFIDLDHVASCDIEVGAVLLVGSISGTATLTFHSHWYDFKY